MGHVFISYCREDADFAQTVEEEIKAGELATWRDLNIGAGDDWRAEIDDRIKGALALVVVMSRQSCDSIYVSFEWAFALGSGVPVIPILLGLTYSDLHPRLSTTQALDFSDDRNRPWDSLLKAIKEIAAAERPFTVRVPRDAPPVVQQAARALDSMDVRERQSAILSLGQMSHSAATEALAEAVRHPIQQVRLEAAIQLAGFHDARALPALLESQRWKGHEVEPWVISKIGETAVPGLLEAVRDGDQDVRMSAIDALGAFRSNPVVLALVDCLRDPDQAIRRAAIASLGTTGAPEAVPFLREALRSADGGIRSLLVTALAKCGGKAVVPDLIEFTRDPDPDVRHTAVCRLQEIKDNAAVPALVAALCDSYDQAGASAARALQDIGDPQAIPGLIAAWGGTDSRLVAKFVADAVKSFGNAAVPALREALHHEQPRVRSQAVEIVGDLGDDADLPALLDSLNDKSAAVRCAAVRALGRRRGPEVVRGLAERLRDDDEDIAQAAVYALGGIRDVGAVAALIECLQDEDDEMVQAAASELESINTRPARIALKARKQQAGK